MSDQIDVNQLSNALQQKVDLPSGKSQADIDYVVESQLPTSENNYTWYRLYKSGWVEQGGIQDTLNKTIYLLVNMKDTNYIVNCGFVIANYGAQYVTKYTDRFSTTSSVNNSATNGGWEVKGMSAQS